MSPNLQEKTEFDTDHGFGSGFFAPPAPPIHVEFGAASHVGLVREGNEDHFAILRRTRTQEPLLTSLGADAISPSTSDAYCFVIADGMGGAAAGEVASRVAIQRACELTDRACSWVMQLRSLAAQQVQERVDAFVTEVHRTLRAMGEADPSLAGMGTTFTTVYVVGWNALIAQVGDSRAYLWRQDVLKQITHDQTLAQLLIDSGVPPEDAAGVRHILTNSLGGKSDVIAPNVGHVVLRAGDRLLLCTDGLTNDVADNEIAEVLERQSSPQAACDALIQLALERGGKDNVTVILAELAAEPSATTEWRAGE